MSKKRPQKYYVPELDKEIKVECLMGSHKYVVHYPTGPERATWSEVNSHGWEHRGDWKDQEEA